MNRRTAVRIAVTLLLELAAFLPAGAATKFIQDVMLIGGTKEDVAAQLLPRLKQGWSYIDKDLNDGCGSNSDYIHLLYKNDSYGDGFNYGSITDFYIYSWNGDDKTPPDTKTIGGRTYYLVPCAGGADFVEGKGDLNEGAGQNSDYIYLYYTRDPFPDGRVITGITFNAIQSGALGTNGGTAGYDLNSNCGAGTNYIYMHVTSTTALTPLQIGNGTSGTNIIPFYLGNTEYPYSVSQQIYTAEEIGKAGTIKAISFNHRAAVETLDLEGIQIFMKHTDKESFTGTELDPMADFSKVYDGDVFFSGPGWVTIHLDTAFEYDGNSNLMICCYESSSTHSTGNTFSYHNVENKMRRFASHNPFSLNGTLAGTLNTTMRNDIQLNIVPNPYGNPVALTLTSATETTASFSWRAPSGTNSGLTGYAWQYKKAGDAIWSNLTTTTGTSASISRLSPDTEYLIRVKAIYGSKESSFTILRFITAVHLPYTMGFENGMPGWSQVDYNHYYNIDYTGISDIARHDGAYGYLFEHYVENPVPQYLISPGLPGDEITVSFYYRNYAASSYETFQVGYSTETMDISDFNWRDEICDNSTEWQRYERHFPAGTRYIAVKYLSNLYQLFLDDFEVVAYSSYLKPTNLRVDELGEQSVKLEWAGPSDGTTGYACQYRAVDGGEWSAEKSVSSAPVTLSGLSPNTTYDFRVKAFHGSNGTNASNFETIRFMTEGPMESLPHYQDFESGMGGWRLENGYGRSGITAREQHGGAYSFEFDEGSPQAQYLRSPLLEGNSPKLLTFNFKTYSEQTGESTYQAYASTFHVGWSTETNSLSDFHESAAVEAATSGWERQTYQLPEGTRYAYIKVDDHKAWLYVDDISITDVPLPEAVAATVMGETKYVTTFYSGSKSWRLPSGALAYTVTRQDDDLVFYRLGDESNIIPAGRAVVIVADKAANDTETTKVINLTITDSVTVPLLYENLLTGSDTPVAVSGGKIDGKTVYVLGIVNGKLDFYPFAGSEIPAGKAYYLAE